MNFATKIKKALESSQEPMTKELVGLYKVILLLLPIPGWLVIYFLWWEKEVPIVDIFKNAYYGKAGAPSTQQHQRGDQR